MANKLLGQHFLKDPSGTITGKIMEALAPARGETIIEIGAGHGELTRPLADACLRNGARLVVIEKDPRLAENLRNEFAAPGGRGDGEDAVSGGIPVVQGDALKILRGAIRDLIGGKEFDPQKYKLVGNIPYYLTGHLLRIVSELDEKPSRCVFMVQKEVAERILAAPPRMNRLAASVQFWAEPRVIASVSKEKFSPVPKVDSAVLLLSARSSAQDGGARARPKTQNRFPAVTSEQYHAAIRTLFAQPRKTLLNNLIARAEKGKILDVLQEIGADPNARPQNLNIETITHIARLLWG